MKLVQILGFFGMFLN